jgi:hypothetical protein
MPEVLVRMEGRWLRCALGLLGIRLVLDLAEVCEAYHNRNVRNLRVRRLQSDEIWQFGDLLPGATSATNRMDKSLILNPLGKASA